MYRNPSPRPAITTARDSVAAMRSDPNHIHRQALKDNDVINWTPRRPMRLYHCAGDGDVVFANPKNALARFHARRTAQVELIDPFPQGDHGGRVLPSLLDVKTWFDSLKQ